MTLGTRTNLRKYERVKVIANRQKLAAMRAAAIRFPRGGETILKIRSLHRPGH
jgi:hypothetical protein